MALDKDELIDALRNSQRTWSEEAVLDLAADPAGLKARSDLCAQCEKPCREEEICATVVVNELGLLDQMGREQAFHLVESGIKRLVWKEKATSRKEEHTRPNEFVSTQIKPDR